MQITRDDLNDLLQEVAGEEIHQLADKVSQKAVIHILQNPTQQTLLAPVLDPVSNTTFYGGEVLVTTAVVQVHGSNGWAMVMDDNHKLALDMAILDGAWGAALFQEDITQLARKGAELQAGNRQTERNEVAATKVNFDLL